jgi:ATP-dependent protease HslVU (ClpYQ) peptidase subunit
MSNNLEFLFPGSNCKSFYDITNAVLKMNKDWMNTEAYGNVRTSLQKIMNTNVNSISSSPNPFTAIDNNLTALGEGSSYLLS